MFLYDIRFEFASGTTLDNPFPGDQTRAKYNKLSAYIKSHADEFVEIDFLNESRYLQLDHCQSLFGTAITGLDISDNPIIYYIKTSLERFATHLTPETLAWARTGVQDAVTGGFTGLTGLPETPVNAPAENQTTTDVDSTVNTVNDTEANTPEETGFTSPLQPSSFADYSVSSFSRTVAQQLMNYDTSTDRCLTYTEVCQLTLRLAKQRLEPESPDETAMSIEISRKKDLIRTINRYRDVPAIAAMDDSDISDYSVAQLEACLEKCKQYHDILKLNEVATRGVNVGGALYDVIFPEGIKIKSKRVNLKGCGRELVNTLFDPRSAVGLSFANIIHKHNIHITDELLLLIAAAGVCAQHIKITDDVPDEKEDKNNDNNSEINESELEYDDVEETDAESEA